MSFSICPERYVPAKRSGFVLRLRKAICLRNMVSVTVGFTYVNSILDFFGISRA